jgi:3'(2'), 5'-bisphosphate nucleotidase
MTKLKSESWQAVLVSRVIPLAREAGWAILALYNETNSIVNFKGDNSPLTQADLASHRVIVNGLNRLSPVWPILSEESAPIPFHERKTWRYFWMVDPLDGTKEFLCRNGEFTVNIALMKCNMPILGVVYAPVTDTVYFAAAGAGAMKISGGIVSPIRARRAGRSAIRVVLSRSHSQFDDNLKHFTRGAENCEYIVMGSSLKFCLVAEGAADIYPRFGPTMEWDTAAAHCILEEAGGTVSDLDGNSMIYNKPELLNPGFVVRGIPEAV